MNLNDTFQAIADKYGLEAEQLKQYAIEDTVGGWDEVPDGQKTTRNGNPLWECGSIWEVEAVVLYALIRVVKPLNVLEIGGFQGCSTAHICEALIANGVGKLTTIDKDHANPVIDKRYKAVRRWLVKDFEKYKMPTKPYDFVFEDSVHTPEFTAMVWRKFFKVGKTGGFIVSHDATHYRLGELVRAGISQVTTDYLPLNVDYGKCGLAIGRIK
jgi:predicted O-methyltransferase YrrM